MLDHSRRNYQVKFVFFFLSQKVCVSVPEHNSFCQRGGTVRQTVPPLWLWGVLGGALLVGVGGGGGVSRCHSGLLWVVDMPHSPLQATAPACQGSWHPPQTSQGGWKLNRGSLLCLMPEETCVCAHKRHSSLLLLTYFLRLRHKTLFSSHLSCGLLCYLCQKCFVFFYSFSAWLLWPPNTSLWTAETPPSCQGTAARREKNPQHKYTHGSQRALSRLLARQHDKPKPHFTPGLAGIYWVSSHTVGERKKQHLTPAKTISQLRDQRENKRQWRKKSRNVTCQDSGRLAENFGSTVYTQLREFIPVYSSDSMESVCSVILGVKFKHKSHCFFLFFFLFN